MNRATHLFDRSLWDFKRQKILKNFQTFQEIFRNLTRFQNIVSSYIEEGSSVTNDIFRTSCYDIFQHNHDRTDRSTIDYSSSILIRFFSTSDFFFKKRLKNDFSDSVAALWFPN